MNYIENYNRLVASRDNEGTIRIRADYLANKDILRFYSSEEMNFTVSKKIVYKTSNVIVYTMVVSNIGESDITTPIILYSDNDGIFTVQKIFDREVIGTKLVINGLKKNQQYRSMFMVRQLENREEVLRLIKELTDDTIYGKKVLSIFERLKDKLKDDKELFLEGIMHNPHVINYASESLRKEIELVAMLTDKMMDVGN